MPADTGRAASPTAAARGPVGVRLQILGPLRVWRDGVELDAGPQQQAKLLAVLLARAGRPTTTAELTEVIWGQTPPPSALNTIQRYVGALRRLLEPALPARGAGSFLHRRGAAYVCVAGPDTLDLADFRELVDKAETDHRDGRDAAALHAYARALALWAGPAGAGIDRRTSVTSIFAPLHAEFLQACATATGLALALGEPERVLPALRTAATIEPFHEQLHAHLMTALGAAGQPAAAMDVYLAMRTRLVDELGIEPGDALRTAHRRLLDPPRPPPAPRIRADSPNRPVPGLLVGRRDELATMWTAVESALTGGSGIAAVEGEPGIGKTRLLQALDVEAGRRGMIVVWGRCVEGDGTPALWPWVQIARSILRSLPPATRSTRLTADVESLITPDGDVFGTSVLPDTGARFRLFERVTAVISALAGQRPTLIVLDDIQWADQVSMQLLEHLVARMPGRTAVVCAFRTRAPAPSAELVRMLAGISRVVNHRRLRLEPLSPGETVDLVEHEVGSALPEPAVRTVHERAGGNPFFVLELARLLVGEMGRRDSAASRLGVPATVRDVVRQRMSGLDDRAVAILQVAALAGMDVDLGVVARAGGVDEQSCLDRLQTAEELGLIGPHPANPRTFRFAHDLVREAVIEATPVSRRPKLHLDVADALDALGLARELSTESYAYHLWSAGPLADPTRTVQALVRAGRAAAAKGGFEGAERHLQEAVEIARAVGPASLELDALAQLIAAIGMRAGYVGASLEPLERAERLARALGRDREAADLLFSRYCAYSQGIALVQAGRLARRLRQFGETSADPMGQSYGWAAWGIHHTDIGQIDEASRYLAQANRAVPSDETVADAWPLRRDLRLLWPVWSAFTTGLHGDLDTARRIFADVDEAAEDDPYAITVWATFSVAMGALAGDAAGVLSAAGRGISIDPEWSYGFLGSYQRLGLRWARAVLGERPSEMATEAEQIIATRLQDPPRSGLATWCCLVAEMWLIAGKLDEASAALDRVDRYFTSYGQRYPEGLLLLLRARLMLARGVPTALVSSAAQRALAVSTERGAHLFARRAEAFLGELKAGWTPS